MPESTPNESRGLPNRKRRTADEARRTILDAAETRVERHGPDALRLQEIAADIGVSHPAVLHHFGSREKLLNAVVERVFLRVQHNVIQVLRRGGEMTPAAIVLECFDVLVETGHARMLCWLLLTGARPEDARRNLLDEFASVIHGKMTESYGDRAPQRRDVSQFLLVVASAALGMGAGQSTLLQSAGLGSTNASWDGFRTWLAEWVDERLQPVSIPASAAE